MLVAVEKDAELSLRIDPKVFEGMDLPQKMEFLLLLVKENGLVLEHILEEFQNDQEIVIHAVKQNGLAIQYAGDFCKQDLTVVVAALTQTKEAWEYIPENLKKLYWLQAFADRIPFQHAMLEKQKTGTLTDVLISRNENQTEPEKEKKKEPEKKDEKKSEKSNGPVYFFKKYAASLTDFFKNTEDKELKCVMNKVKNSSQYTSPLRELFFSEFLGKVQLKKDVVGFFETNNLGKPSLVIETIEQSLKEKELKAEKPLSIPSLKMGIKKPV